jgi:radical SAM superfamily enzyme YgiQ (UPF0313 family)
LKNVFETNLIKKDHRKVRLKFAICYPEPYRVGMSCLAIHTIYSMLNSARDVACERAFLQPTSSDGTRTLESNMPLRKMDVVGFSLQYEIDYVNVLKILIDSRIPPLWKDRSEEDPLIIAGGPCATGNPEPMSEFIDIFAIGEAESILPQLVDRLVEIKNPRAHLSDLLDVDGLYIPSLNQNSVDRIWVRDLDLAQHPTKQVTPHFDGKSRTSPVFGETFLAEVTRGCGHGCRFCYIGYVGRPYRERTIGKMEEIIEQGVKYTGVNKVSLIGSGLSDYSHLTDICGWIVDDQRLNLSLSSLRADSVSQELVRILAKGGERTLTIAPETGSEALRRSLNKKITDEDIICAAENALEAGMRNIKLYFMVGLPGEESQDIQDMGSLVKRIAKLGYSPRSIRLSVTPFVPKPHTAFQWFSQASPDTLQAKFKTIRSSLGSQIKVDVETLDFRWARIEAILSVADRKIGNTLKQVAEAGGTLGSWKRVITKSGPFPSISEPSRSTEDELPWDRIHVGVSKDFLRDERDKAGIHEESSPCGAECSKCGVC